MENGKISSYQLFCLVTIFLTGSTTILQSVNIAGRDTWISSIIGVFAGMCLAILMTVLYFKHPGMTLIELLQFLFGRIIGKFVGGLYLFYFLHLASLVLRNYGDFLSGVVMQETPLWFFHVTLGAVVAYFVYQRLEVMARVSEIAFAAGMSISMFTSVFINMSGIAKAQNIFPVSGYSLQKVLQGAIPSASFPFLEIIVFMMIIPYLDKPRKARKVLTGGTLLAGAVLTIILIQDIMVFGEYMATLTFPRYSAVRMISVGRFVDRIEPGILVVWIMGGLIKIGVCLYAFVLGFAQLLGLSDYKFIVVPSTVILVVMSIQVYKNVFQMLNFATNIYPVYAFPFEVMIPVIMVCISFFKKKKHL